MKMKVIEVKDLKFREGKNTVNVSFSVANKTNKEFGRMARMEFEKDWGVFIVQKMGIHFKMPKKFFEKQLKDNTDALEFTFTVPESDAFLELIRLYQKGESYLKEMENKKCLNLKLR